MILLFLLVVNVVTDLVDHERGRGLHHFIGAARLIRGRYQKINVFGVFGPIAEDQEC